jgi:transketolase
VASPHAPQSGQSAWADRDRFVLSNGHGSMLIYALLHLTGYDLSIDDLKQFRQLSRAPPATPSSATRQASKPPPARSARASPTRSAWRWLKRCWPPSSTAGPRDRQSPHLRLPRRRLPDGRRLARSLLAGRHLGLGKLIAFWDDNGISIDGHVEGWFTDDTPKRFESYGWHVIPPSTAITPTPSRKPCSPPRRSPTSRP